MRAMATGLAMNAEWTIGAGYAAPNSPDKSQNVEQRPFGVVPD